MPLQIRRGTNAERQALIPSNGLVVGELLYITDSQQVYIGTGNSGEHQGLAVTGFTNENAVDAAGTALVAGVHSGITFTYGSTQDTAGRIDAAVDLSNYTGTITASAFKGSVFGDDSTPIVDAINNTLNGNLNGNVTGDVTGNLFGNVTGNVTGNVSGNVTGSIRAADSTTMVNATNKTFVGDLTGDVKGSIVSDDSTILVDAVSGTLRTSSIVLQDTNISSITSILNLGTPADPLATLSINTEDNQIPVRIYGAIDTFTGNFRGPFTERFAYRGTLASPQIIQNSDFISGDVSVAYVGNEGSGGDGYAFVGAQGFGHDAGTPISNTSNFLRGFWFVALSDGSSVDFNNTLSFRPNGSAYAPIFTAIPKTTSAISSITPEEGMMVFNTSTKKFQGYDGTSWVNLN